MDAQKRKTETTRKAWPYARPMANDSLMMKMPENTPPMKNDSLHGKHLACHAGYRHSLLLMNFATYHSPTHRESPSTSWLDRSMPARVTLPDHTTMHHHIRFVRTSIHRPRPLLQI